VAETSKSKCRRQKLEKRAGVILGGNILRKWPPNNGSYFESQQQNQKLKTEQVKLLRGLRAQIENYSNPFSVLKYPFKHECKIAAGRFARLIGGGSIFKMARLPLQKCPCVMSVQYPSADNAASVASEALLQHYPHPDSLSPELINDLRAATEAFKSHPNSKAADVLAKAFACIRTVIDRAAPSPHEHVFAVGERVILRDLKQVPSFADTKQNPQLTNKCGAACRFKRLRCRSQGCC
jgi:hypothetical protein